MEPAVPLSRFSPRLGDWRETDGCGRPQQEEADAAEPESLTHAETGTPVKVDDSWSGPIDTS